MPHSLLPNGFEDRLSPDASQEARAVEQLAQCFERFGYDRVKPPLLEFEETLTAALGEDSSDQLLRVPDPITNKMLGVRADMTVQVARLAMTRLRNSSAPLRLCYHGQVVRAAGEELRPTRQLTQVGFELIGLPQSCNAIEMLASDLEALRLVRFALSEIGIGELQIDVTLPSLMAALVEDFELSNRQQQALASALDNRDAAALDSLDLPGEAGALIAELLALPAEGSACLEALGSLFTGEAVRRQVGQASAFVEALDALLDKAVTVTVDPTEQRSSAYHHNIGFNLYAKGQIIGRGGRYEIEGERATGCTFYMDGLVGLLPAPQPAGFMVAVGMGASAQQIEILQAEGHRTLLVAVDKPSARAAGATHILSNGQLEELD